MIVSMKAPLVRREVLFEGVQSMSFNVPSSFSFRAGQYVTIAIPGLEHLPKRDQFRDFSITSSPHELPQVTITYRTGNSEYKKKLASLSEGQEVVISGPKGVFTLPEDETPVCFVAGGIGVTPFVSMIRFLINTQSSRKISLYYFNHAGSQVPYLAELESYKAAVSLHTIYERPTATNFLPSQEDASATWFLAGPPGMLHTVLELLEHAGIEDQRIKTEEFTGYE